MPKLGPAPKVGSDGSKNPTPGDVPNPQPLLDDSTPQKLDPEETREYLRRTEERFRQERRNLPRPPDRPGVRDW
jgi:hypothetical protein